MAKAIIKSEYGEGFYQVELDHGQAAYEAEKAQLEAKIVVLNTTAAELSASLDAEQVLLEQYADELDASIGIYAAHPTEEYKALVDTGTRYLRNQRKVVDGLTAQINQVQLDRASIQRRLGILFDIYENEPETLDIWCADYNTGLTGEVGTIELGLVSGGLPGKVDSPVSIIRPAGTSGELAIYNSVADGKLLPTTMMTPEAAFYSHALLPATAKWTPRYRTGIITETDGDTCTVELDPVFSTQQSLDVNQAPTVLAGFNYMNCNGTAFEVDDHVIVAFTGREWENSNVIGFVKEPRPCTSQKVYSRFTPRNNTTDWNYETFTAPDNSTSSPVRPAGSKARYGLEPTVIDLWHLYDQDGVDDERYDIAEVHGTLTNGPAFAVSGFPAVGQEPWSPSYLVADTEPSVTSVAETETHTYFVGKVTIRRPSLWWAYGFPSIDPYRYWRFASIPDPYAFDSPYRISSQQGPLFFYGVLYRINKSTGEKNEVYLGEYSAVDNMAAYIADGGTENGFLEFVDNPPPWAASGPDSVAHLGITETPRKIGVNDDYIAILGSSLGNDSYGTPIDRICLFDKSLNYAGTLVDNATSPRLRMAVGNGWIAWMDGATDATLIHVHPSGGGSWTFNIDVGMPTPPSPYTLSETNQRFFDIEADGDTLLLFYRHTCDPGDSVVEILQVYQYRIKNNAAVHLGVTHTSNLYDKFIKEFFVIPTWFPAE
jgi:hypothetical protein